jgi:hypothetical protein
MYSPKRLLTQEPNAVSAAVMAVLNIFIMTGALDWNADVVAGVNTALVLVLGLVYVRPLSVSKSGLEELTGG